MAEVVLFHHIQGLTAGVVSFADDLRRPGHTVHTPDLFDGCTFGTIEDGFAFAKEAGFDTIRQRGAEAADGLGSGLVYAGFSFGLTIAQRLAQTDPGARGALLIYSCLPVTEFGEAWPATLPAQIHGKEGDEFFEEDLPAARELAESSDAVDLYLYPGDQHLFADASLSSYDPDAAELLASRVLDFLDAI